MGFRTLCDNPLHHNIQWERLHMTAQLIDGKALARSMEAKLAERIRALPRKPVLAVLLVGEASPSATRCSRVSAPGSNPAPCIFPRPPRKRT